MLLSFLGELEAAVDGTVGDVDIEFLHDLRVAVRRSRSAVKLLGDVLPPALVAWVTPELKYLGDLTTPSRDLDVLAQELPALTAGLPAAGARTSSRWCATSPGSAPTSGAGWCSACGRRGSSGSAHGGAPRCWRWRPGTGSPVPGPIAAEVVVERLDRAHRRVLRRGSRITDASPAEDLHDLRKRVKELRYLLEIFPADGSGPTPASPSRS